MKECFDLKSRDTLDKIQVKIADTFFSRMYGLLGTKYLEANRGLLIRPCNSVHMFGMNYAIDVIYLDENERILRIAANLKPWQFSFCWPAKEVLEVAAGTAEKMKWQVGDYIGFEIEEI